MKPILRVENLGKRYDLGGRRACHETFRESLVRTVKRCVGLGGPNPAATVEAPFWALREVSFDVLPGEVVGVIGRNGAGKSTLLKILSRIIRPTIGEADLYGRIASLLEVGTGFHPELTGRENVFLSGAILGMRRQEIRRKFDEIAAFAEVERFLDTPVKRYSSGMYMRLAFAVAAHMEPEILLVDEVLAVGDTAFQKKCLTKMGEVARGGRTVLFVSHNLAAVRKLCPRTLLLQGGRLHFDGETRQAVSAYLGEETSLEGRFNPAGRQGRPGRAQILDAWLEKDSEPAGHFLFDDGVELVIDLETDGGPPFSIELMLRQADGIPAAFAPSGLAQDWDIHSGPGRVRVRAQLPPLRLAAGRYSIDLILAESGIRFLDRVESAVAFHVDSSAVGNRNWQFKQGTGQGHSLWDVRFQVCEKEMLSCRE
jgi:lipopolysaccharide transport system ATP-binding protein